MSESPQTPRDQLTQLRIGEGWIQLRIHGEPFVKATFRGYTPVLEVENLHSQTRHFLYMSAKTFMEGIEPLRVGNSGRFDGLQFRIRKEADDRFARYLIES